MPVKRALVIVAFLVAAPPAARALPLLPGAHEPQRPTRYQRLKPIPWLWRQIDLERQNTGLNGRKNAIRSEQMRAGPKDAHSWDDKPLSDF